MADQWVEKPLGAILELQRGFDLPAANWNNGPIFVIASTGPVGCHDRAMVKGPGVVIGRFRPHPRQG